MSIRVEDATGARDYTDELLPLSIGAHGDADVRLSGASDAPSAYVGKDRTYYFIQPTAHTVVQVNDVVISASAWLQSGDHIKIAGQSIRCRDFAGGIALSVESESNPGLRPPEESPPTRVTRAGKGWGRAIALGALGILVMVALGVFLATPIEVNVNPPPDRMIVNGLLPTQKIGPRYLAIPGTYTVVVEKGGYHSINKSFDVKRGAVTRLDLSLEKLPGRVTVVTTPTEGVEVSVDGHVVGTSPFAPLELPAGERKIVAKAERYLDADETVNVIGLGEAQTVSIALTPGWSKVNFSSVPEGAEVRRGEELLGETPFTTELLAGKYDVRVLKPKFESQTITLDIEANVPIEVPVTLVPANATLSISSTPSGATVTVDGKYQGVTPLQVSLVPDAVHKVSVAKAGFGRRARDVTLAAGAVESLTLRLSASKGVVFFSSDPPDAELIIDDKSMGPAVQRLVLAARSHQVEIRKSGYQPFKTTVTPRAGVSRKVTAKLVALEAGKRPVALKRAISPRGLALALVRPRGVFNMGASRREQGRRANESPRQVQLTRSYYLGAKEVTNAEFRKFRSGHNSGVGLNGDNQPVVGVTWGDAARFMNWLSEKENLRPAYTEQNGKLIPVAPLTNGYRLPLEAEWAFAARNGGTGSESRKYAWGTSFPPVAKVGNYADQSAIGAVSNVLPKYTDGFAKSAPVGSFKPNPLGLFDLDGNVAEWCHDYYDVYDGANPRVQRDPMGPKSGRHHVIRGASWRHSSITQLRMSYRNYGEKPRPDVGFRIARYAD